MGISISNQLLGSTGLSVGRGLSRGGGLYFAGFGGAPFTPASLFASGAPGFLLDATLADLSSLFQDSAGTIPVTAVEQPVGLALDDSRDAVGTNGAKRVNLLNWTEAFNDAAWVNSGTLTVSANDAIAPDGTTTADKFNVTALTVDGDAGRYQVFNGIAVQYLLTYYVKPDTMTVVRCGMYDGSNFATRDFTFSTKSFGNARGTLSVGSTVYEELPNGWYRLSITVTSGMVSSSAFMAVYSASTGSGWFWGADLRLASEASTAPTPYQRINANWPSTMAGNHFVQSTSAARPVLSARVNLLTKTEQFDDGVWTKSTLNVTANTNVAPDGTTTADTVASNGVSSTPAITQVATISSITNYIARLYVLKTSGATRFPSSSLYFAGGGTAREWGCVLNTNTGVAYPASGWADGAPTTTVTSVGDYWLLSMQQASLTGNTTAQTFFSPGVNTTGNSGTRSPTTTGSNVIWGADLRPANDTASPVYQRVNTATDYATTGFPLYLRYDGVDDFLVSAATVNFSTTAQMSMFAGVRKLSDAASGLVLDFAVDPTLVSGTITLSGPSGAATSDYFWRSRGTSNGQGTTAGSYTAPISNVLTGLGDISADVAKLRVNGIEAVNSVSDQGSGNYGNYLNYIGSRGGGSLRLNGRIYFPMVVLGRTATATEITNMESYLSASMGGGYVPTGYDFLVTADGDQLTDASGNALYTIPLYS